MEDPRPLTTEPLALDLVNTAFMHGGAPRDLLSEPGGAARWVAAIGHPAAPADASAQAALLQARAAIRAALDRTEGGGGIGAVLGLNAVLAHGRLVERLAPAGPERTLEIDAEHWRVPWLAAQNLLELLRTGPDRIRECAGHSCVLRFYDASRAGRRQWCSMASCGNRAKARRHYERAREGGAGERHVNSGRT